MTTKDAMPSLHGLGFVRCLFAVSLLMSSHVWTIYTQYYGVLQYYGVQYSRYQEWTGWHQLRHTKHKHIIRTHLRMRHLNFRGDYYTDSVNTYLHGPRAFFLDPPPPFCDKQQR